MPLKLAIKLDDLHMDLDPRPGKMQPLVLLVRLDQKNLLWGPDLVFDLRTAGLLR